MKIPFVTHSRFTGTISTELRASEGWLRNGETIRVALGKSGGYRGSVRVSIPRAGSYFGTDWEGKDPTRFPARIRAAATALRDAGLAGEYILTHENGALTIAPVQHEIR